MLKSVNILHFFCNVKKCPICTSGGVLVVTKLGSHQDVGVRTHYFGVGGAAEDVVELLFGVVLSSCVVF